MSSSRTLVAKIKCKVILYAGETKICEAGRKCKVAEANVRRWKLSKQKLLCPDSTWRSFSGPKRGHFHAAAEQAVEFVHSQRGHRNHVTRKTQSIPEQCFKASAGRCERTMCRNGFCSQHGTCSAAVRLPTPAESALHPALTRTENTGYQRGFKSSLTKNDSKLKPDKNKLGVGPRFVILQGITFGASCQGKR
uniref:Uncharacterized protein n=1 Tax=Apteryx owenii TaxID=8824 RepID=A0A8B9QFH5_APTOW